MTHADRGVVVPRPALRVGGRAFPATNRFVDGPALGHFPVAVEEVFVEKHQDGEPKASGRDRSGPGEHPYNSSKKAKTITTAYTATYTQGGIYTQGGMMSVSHPTTVKVYLSRYPMQLRRLESGIDSRFCMAMSISTVER